MATLNLDHLADFLNRPVETALEQAEKELVKHGQGQKIVPDGKIHRYDAADKPGKKSCWYIFFSLEDMIAGCFGRWDTDTFVKFRSFDYREECAEEIEFKNAAIEQAIAHRDAERKRLAAEAAVRAAEIFEAAMPATSGHSYLAKKKIDAHGLKLSKSGALIVPMSSIDGNLTSLQFIAQNGEKRFLSGGAVKGAFYRFGGEADRVYVVEGYASGATVFEQLHAPVYVAFSANNLPEVVKAIRSKYEYCQVVIVADNDDTGKKYAKQAADLYGAMIITPPVEGQDINDYWLAGGSVVELLRPAPKPWLVNADEFCAKPDPIKWLAKHWIQEQSLMMIFGPSGCGKTFIVLDACLHIASGAGNWYGKKIKRAPVVYLAGEGHFGLKARVAGWKQVHKPESPLDMWISSGGAKLDNEKSFQKVVEELRQLPVKPALIVVDTVHRFLEGDENSAQDAGDFVFRCDELKRLFGCAVWLVHHTGVSDDAKHRARGSSAWRGDLDIESCVTKNKDGTITLKQTKNKDAEPADDLVFDPCVVVLDGWYDDDGEAVTTLVLRAEGQSKPQRMEGLHAFFNASGGEIKKVDDIKKLFGDDVFADALSGNILILHGADDCFYNGGVHD